MSRVKHQPSPERQKKAAGAPTSAAASATVVLGRLLFALIFLLAAPAHFSRQTIENAAAQGVPFAAVAVPLSGVIALSGALSILLGYRARIGAWLIVLFLIPVTFKMHAFWSLSDAAAKQVQLIMFMKNLSLIGAALLLSQFGAGPWSLDAYRRPTGKT